MRCHTSLLNYASTKVCQCSREVLYLTRLPVSFRGDVHVQVVWPWRRSGSGDDQVIFLVVVAGALVLLAHNPQSDGDVGFGATLDEGGSVVRVFGEQPLSDRVQQGFGRCLNCWEARNGSVLE